MECCGTCSEVALRALHECDCEMCACGHCIHKHEKWRWHRICSVCTPHAWDDGLPDWRAELNKHRPVGDNTSIQ